MRREEHLRDNLKQLRTKEELLMRRLLLSKEEGTPSTCDAWS